MNYLGRRAAWLGIVSCVFCLVGVPDRASAVSCPTGSAFSSNVAVSVDGGPYGVAIADLNGDLVSAVRRPTPRSSRVSVRREANPEHK